MDRDRETPTPLGWLVPTLALLAVASAGLLVALLAALEK